MNMFIGPQLAASWRELREDVEENMRRRENEHKTNIVEQTSQLGLFDENDDEVISTKIVAVEWC